MSSPYINISSSELFDDAYNGTVQNVSGLRLYTSTGSTDANGRITFLVTDTGLVGGNALFSSVFTIQATGGPAVFTAVNVPVFYVESVSADRKTIIIRGAKGTTLVALGATMTFVGAGVTAYITMIGLD